MSGIQSVSVSAAQSYASVGAQSQQSLQPFGKLDLTEAQRTQIRSIFTAAKQNGTSQADVENQLNAVLTPAQQQTLAADFKTGDGRSGHHHHEENSATSQASSPQSAASTSAASPTSTILEAVTNIRNQAAAAQSTLVDSLQQNVLSQNGTPVNE